MKNRTTIPNIIELQANEIFVFGSNSQGNHDAGAAKLAVQKFGATRGQSKGLQGKSYGINTMSGIEVITEQVNDFIQYAKDFPKYTFLVTEIGCGIAGFKPEEIAPLFETAKNVENINLPEKFWRVISPIKGYKVFDSKFQCRGFQFKENSEFITSEKIILCQSGFHLCLKVSDCFSYYGFTSDNIVCEVEVLGDYLTHEEDYKIVTNHIKIGRKLSWEEVLNIVNTGKDNAGHRNSGDRNSGHSNSGDSNSGDRNSGYRNSGDSNSGDRNSGHSNSGDRNSGHSNSGDSNSGHSNSGYSNSGHSNSGHRNSGHSNSGHSNSGDRNSGHSNSGNWNSGDRNSGDSNSGYRNSGAFCLDKNPKAILFDKESSLTIKEWENSKAVQIMSEYLYLNIWIQTSVMTEQEKENHPKYETTEGYLKNIPLKEAWGNMWNNLSEENKKVFKDIENFDSKIFEEITGIKI